MFIHCQRKFRPDEIQFLYDNDLFTHRKLEIGVCPECDELLVRLIEKRIIDGIIFDSVYSSGKAEQIIEKYKNIVEYTNLDNKKQQGLYGFRYGINTIKTDKKSQIATITQKSCDFFGNKEVVKKFKT